MNEAIENVVSKNDEETLRGRCAHAHLPCCDRGDDNGSPAFVPGEFTVRLGDVMPAYVLEGLEEEFRKFGGATGAVSGFLSAMNWVEDEVRGFPDLLEGLARLKGALMAVGASRVGRW